ncbi:hypothetical protein [Streptomyces sp. PSKA30]|uniref:hypothetical protein n=1 Tax=Streptomyces sp. PSKA30 TaxID=2874597 RepID=UPI001CD15658|nr:hypothetical protein [Streptomyces sp. PSKA30]MBZ9644319.1 hypothetical protein [Streptomyces sp. PSKA30]
MEIEGRGAAPAGAPRGTPPTRALTLVEDPVQAPQLRNRIAHHEGIWRLPLEARRDDLHTVLGFIDPAAATWVAGASRIDDVLAQRP